MIAKSKTRLEVAAAISNEVLRPWAPDVDASNRFPKESIDSLRKEGLLAFFVPEELGGLGGDYREFVDITSMLGAGCLSTAMIWAMHSQQTAVLRDHLRPEQADLLATIARQGSLVASVTSEFGKGGELFVAEAALRFEENQLRVCRKAPIVSYGGEADYFLITMRSGEECVPSDVSLVLIDAMEGSARVTGDWNAMGMRGTRSVPMEFDGIIDSGRIVGDSFRRVALQTMIPAGHLGWAASWYGAARGAYQRLVSVLRTMGARREVDLMSSLFKSRLANLHLSLDMADAMLSRSAEELDRMRKSDMPFQAYEDLGFIIRLNNLKVGVSRLAFSVVDGLIELAGLSTGYLKGHELGLERIFRDLRSAALMYNNDRLIDSNAHMILLDQASRGPD